MSKIFRIFTAGIVGYALGELYQSGRPGLALVALAATLVLIVLPSLETEQR